MASSPARFALDYDGHGFAVETASAGTQTVARLFVDGQQVDEQKGMDKSVHLEGGGLTVVVGLNWLGQVTRVLAVPSGADPKSAEEQGMIFAAPAGSHAARLEALQRSHPVLYSARHVAIATAQVLISFIGIGALLQGLLPRINFPDIPWPTLPAIPWPDLPDIPWPDLDLPLPSIDLPDLVILDWIKETWQSVGWLAPIVIAIAVAINEVARRRNREKSSVVSRQSSVRRQDGKNERMLVAGSW